MAAGAQAIAAVAVAPNLALHGHEQRAELTLLCH